MSDVDAVTLSWIRDESDKKAVANGCRFSLKRARYAVDWIEENCYLHEGVPAGTRIKLEDWQLDFVMRLFGWVRPLSADEPHYNKPKGRTHVRRFRRASIWVPKKNSKSSTVAAIALHLLMADGEHGQNIYTAAKDGKQALIVQGHAMNMVKASPKLRPPVCGINASTKRIFHTGTVSKMDVVAGDNKRSQEGLNGSVIVDECHVVDAELMSILKGAGISRAEPLQIEVSTAGNEPDGYGKQQFDKGMRVSKGLEEDQGFLFLCYAAPQDLKDADLEADPMKYITMANPTLGRIVNPREVLDDYNSSKRSLASLLDFKMYRLNIWQNAANPWIRVGDWASCKEDFTEDAFRGKKGPCGFDFALIHDMVAAVLAIDHPTERKKVKQKDGTEIELPVCRILPRFWMAEEEAKAHPEMPWLEWGEQGHLILTPGNQMDPGYIMTDFLEWVDSLKFKVTEFGYDPSFGAAAVVEMMADGIRDKNGAFIRSGCGAQRVEIAQNPAAMTEPISLFEGGVTDQIIRHNGHPVMNWQISHCEVKAVGRGGKMLQKPDERRGGLRKIDGVVAGTFSYARFRKTPAPSGLEIWSLG